MVSVNFDDGLQRCAWTTRDPVYIAYHDEEWGVPERDPGRLFEMMTLEGFQAGLSWLTILKKRENFRRAFKNFDAATVARFRTRDVERLMGDAGIVRNRAKIEATIGNARAWLTLAKHEGDPAEFLWYFVGGAPKRNHPRRLADVPAKSPEAQAMSKALAKRGFRFVGPTICYAFMQATGMVIDHTIDCFRYRKSG